MPVDLVAHDPTWRNRAGAEAARFGRLVATAGLVTVHHIGSTAIAGICAKPIIDLIPEVGSVAALDGLRPEIERAGYEWHGEYGLPGRRYCTREERGARVAHLHCYERGSPEIARHLAFRDYLVAHPAVARAYEVVKMRCRDEHPSDSRAYTEAKGAWIRGVEAEAMRWVVMGRPGAA